MKQKKTKAQKKQDNRELAFALSESHRASFEAVQEFSEYYTMYECDITMIPAGVISQIMAINDFRIRRAQVRKAQPYVGETWQEDTTPLSVYQEGGEA